MPLIELQIQHFRNLSPERLRFSPTLNVIHGENGSGKTSVLEAIHFLSTGRSFRTHRSQNVVTMGQSTLTVFGQVLHGERLHRIGISRDLGQKETQLKMDGERIRSLALLARELPVSVIEPGTFDIIVGGPGKRRQFLDWLVFHVEPSFGDAWQRCQKSISQRNHLLRNGKIQDAEMAVWDRQLSDIAEVVTGHRVRCFERFKQVLQDLIAKLQLDWASGLGFYFYPGWSSQKTLLEALVESRDQEQKVGHTLHGPHRADIGIRIEGRKAAEVLSRGQQKTLVVLMKLAQMTLVNESSARQGICLLDDIHAELDEHHQAMLAQRLLELGSQLFITSIERPDPQKLWGQYPVGDLKMFHVEHGTFSQEHTGVSGALHE